MYHLQDPLLSILVNLYGTYMLYHLWNFEPFLFHYIVFTGLGALLHFVPLAANGCSLNIADSQTALNIEISPRR